MSFSNNQRNLFLYDQDNYGELLDDLEDEILLLQELENFDPTNSQYNEMKLEKFKGVLKKRYSECIDQYVILIAIRRQKLEKEEWRMIMKNLYPIPKFPSFSSPVLLPKRVNYQYELEKIYTKLLNLRAFMYYQARKSYGYLVQLNNEAREEYSKSELDAKNLTNEKNKLSTFNSTTSLDLLD